MGSKGYIPGVEWQELEADKSTPSSGSINNCDTSALVALVTMGSKQLNRLEQYD